jgi:hypothetical protein
MKILGQTIKQIKQQRKTIEWIWQREQKEGLNQWHLKQVSQ